MDKSSFEFCQGVEQGRQEILSEVDKLRNAFKCLVTCKIAEGDVLLTNVDKYNAMVEIFNNKNLQVKD